MPEHVTTPAPDPDHELVEHLIAYRRPSEADAEVMASLRAEYMAIGHRIVEEIPRTPDRTVALRSLHRACMDTIAALALNPTDR